ncbi:MAG: DUF1800 family protein [Gammaproteobacteria bacterium]|nr:DUF1800 family protein [Gammaproteobacteria bacterium]
MTTNTKTVIASNRFGFGAKPGDLSRIGTSPREWLQRQIERPAGLSANRADLKSSREAVQSFLSLRDKKREKDVSAGVIRMARSMRPVYMDFVMARSIQAIQSPSPFYERLVHFWSNHFAVSADKPQMLGLVGTLEFEAIRPHVNGRFSEMLMAVEKHPATLTYLDNFQSIGPNSLIARHAGKRKRERKFGINENLAREILELHTLGVNGGYSQTDVTNFAKVITGWTYGGVFKNRADRGKAGEFVFNELMHEPGSQRVMNRSYTHKGIKQGEAVLRDLANHEQTAAHLAGKLARHFISDTPSSESIGKLSQAYLQSDGHLPTVYSTLIGLDEVWDLTFSKYKTPNDYVYSVFRTLNFIPETPEQIAGPLSVLGQAPFRSGSPAGWPDTATDWTGGEALFKRVEFAVSVADKVGNRIDPLALSELILGQTLSEQTRQSLSRAESGQQGLALLFASPEFQRR